MLEKEKNRSVQNEIIRCQAKFCLSKLRITDIFLTLYNSLQKIYQSIKDYDIVFKMYLLHIS